jgi:hypothetical protein
VTNPPFSLFREFVAWIFEANKQCLIVGNQGGVGYKEVFPLIQQNRLWYGNGFSAGNAYFGLPQQQVREYSSGVYDEKTGLVKFRNCCWLTNIEHGRRHEPLKLMSMKDNIRYGKHKEITKKGYPHYDNYDAIEVPKVSLIPSDYDGVMGVPITYLGNHNPEEFEILGATQRECHELVPDTKKYDDYKEILNSTNEKTGASGGKTNENANLIGRGHGKTFFRNNEGREIYSCYQRLFIKKRNKK